MNIILIFIQIFFFVLTFILAGLIILSLVQKIKSNFKIKISQDLSFSELFLISLGLGPILISLIIYFLLILVPGKPDWLYVSIVSVIFLIVLYLSRIEFLKIIRKLKIFFLNLPSNFKKQSLRIKIFVFAIILFVLYIVAQSVAFPISGHDASVYAEYGRYIYNQRSLDNYPMSVPDVKTGFYFTGAQHPPGYPLIHTWVYMLQGQVYPDLLPRFVCVFYAILLGALLWTVLKKRKNNFTANMGLVLLVLTPLFLWQSYDNTVDPLRLFFIFSGLLLLAKTIENKSVFYASLTGITLGSALFLHSSAILTTMASLLIFVILYPGWKWEKWKMMLIIILFALAVGGSQYLINFVRFNNILGPSSYDLFNASVKNFYAPAELSRVGMTGNTFVQIASTTKHFTLPMELIYGRLQVFTRPELFGVSYILLLFSLFWWFRKKDKTVLDLIIIWAIFLCFIPIVYKFYTNRRYFLTIYPMVIYLNAIYLSYVWQQINFKKFKIWFYLILLIFLAIILFGLFGSNSVTSSRIGSSTLVSKVKFYLSDKKHQNNSISNGVFGAIDFINKEPGDGLVLTTDDARYFYYANKKGLYWQSPGIPNIIETYSDIDFVNYLKENNVKYVLADPLNGEMKLTLYKALSIKINSNNFEKIYDGVTKVYKIK